MQSPDAAARRSPWPVIAATGPVIVLLPLFISLEPLRHLSPLEQSASTLLNAGGLVAWLIAVCLCVRAPWIALKNDLQRNRWRQYRRALSIVLLIVVLEAMVVFGMAMVLTLFDSGRGILIPLATFFVGVPTAVALSVYAEGDGDNGIP